MDLFSLSNRTALITGATRGIGQQMAIALAEAGSDIILVQVYSSCTRPGPTLANTYSETPPTKRQNSILKN